MAMIPTFLGGFPGGMTNDPSDPNPSHAQVIRHFDIFSKFNSITPYHSTESGDSSASTNQIARFQFANNRLYGLSTASGSSQKLFYRATGDLADATWDIPGNTNVAGVPNGLFFVDYPREGKLYWSLSGVLASFHYADSAYVASAHSLAATAQGLVHSKDNVLYVPCTNVLAANTNGSWSDTALTLPSEYTISSLSEFGNYLAIACKPVNGFGRSKVFLWDRDSSLETISESVDWDVGNLELIEEIEGELIGISTLSGTFKGELVFKSWRGGSAAQTFRRLQSSTSVTSQTLWKQKVNNRLYFNFDITIGGEQQIGIWAIGRAPGGPLAVSLDHLYRNDGITTSDTINGYYLLGDYMFVSYVDANNSFATTMSKTDDQANYTATSLVETVVFNAVLGLRNKHIPDSSQDKKLIGISVTTEPLPSGGQVVVKYRINEETSWTTIMTHSTLNAISHSAVNIESTGGALPQAKEITFRMESTGGAIINAFSFEQEIIPNRMY